MRRINDTKRQLHFRTGFTLIELSITLVIIALLVASIIIGKDMIEVAAIRSQISQIEKLNTTVNAFRIKYNCLPGDCSSASAAMYGFPNAAVIVNFASRIRNSDGAFLAVSGGYGNIGTGQGQGEPALFWGDLSAAGFVDGSFNQAVVQTNAAMTISGSQLDGYLPKAKLGQGNYVYVYTDLSGVNYYGVSASPSILQFAAFNTTTGMSVQQAYAIDIKVDDGLPQSGKVIAKYVNFGSFNAVPIWASGPNLGASGAFPYPPSTSATPGSPTTCYDNSGSSNGTPGVAGAVQHYSTEMGGNNMNCALSFQF
jgi:prepilin-type N-terminal cleavage/methylation domain-containing protein